MPRYKVKYQGEVHDIDWTGSGKPSKDELRLLISNDILKKDAPPPIDNTFKPPTLPKPKDPFKNKYGQTVDEFGLPELYGYKAEKFLSTPLAPDLAEPETYWGGFGKSLYKDFIQPQTTPRSLAQAALTGKTVTNAVRGKIPPTQALPDLPRPIFETHPPPAYIPDKLPDFADEPIPRGSTTYGIRPRPTDDPLLAHVPERYQPTAPVQEHFDQMLPSVIRERIKAPPDILPELPVNSIPESIPARVSANELKGSTLGNFIDEAADTGLPSLTPPGEYKAPSMWSNLMNLTKSAKTTLDISAPLRQGLPRIHTKEYWGAIKPMFKSLMSEEGYQKVVNELQNSPALPVARDAGLAVFEREEQVASNLAEQIPGLGKLAARSNRAYDAFIKKLRMDTFENLVRDATNAGMPIDPKFTRNIAEVINTATGRGTLGPLERHAGLLNNVFFSPKFISSRVQMFNPQYYYKLDPLARKEAIRSTMSLITFGSTLASLAALGGAEVETDTTSSDYGKIKIGDYRLDPYAGMQQYVVLMSKIAQQQQKSPITGNVREFDGKYGSPNGLAVLGRFAQNKLNPVLGFGAKVLEGTDYAGKPLQLLPGFNEDAEFGVGEITKQFIPMLAEDTAEVLMEDPSMLPLMVPSAFGMGVQRFDSDSSGRKSRPFRLSRPTRSSK